MRTDFKFYEIETKQKDLKISEQFEESWNEVFKGLDVRIQGQKRIVILGVERLVGIVSNAKTVLHFNQFIDLACLYGENKQKFTLTYLFKNLFNGIELSLLVPIDDSVNVPTITGIWENVAWAEDEIYDLFGITFNNYSRNRILTGGQVAGFPFNTSKKEVDSRINNNNQEVEIDSYLKAKLELPDYLTCGYFDINLQIDDDMVVASKTEIGFQHKCMEKLSEDLNIHQVNPLVERLNYCSSLLNSIGFCKSIEDLAEIDIPELAQAMRMVFGEFHRILDHLISISHMTYHMRMDQIYDLCRVGQKEIHYLFSYLSDSKIFPSLIVIGGISRTLPKFWVSHALTSTTTLFRIVSELQKSLSVHPVFLEQSKTARVTPEEALNWSFSGPCLRASGVNFDIRKAAPYYFYSQIDFNTPLGINGEIFDRVLVRSSECLESLKIISQVLDNVPAGMHKRENCDDAIGKRQSDFFYSSTEASNGELGFFLQAENSLTLKRLKVRSPSFYHLQAFDKLLVEKPVSEALSFFMSLGINGSEAER
jgi:NADH:ubiquinone oxidoreductase subunit D/NADH:ubiquinone oxidoreductase subunit C